jgi:hypothetical protein
MSSDLFSQILATAGVAGIISAVVNYFLTIRKTKLDREANIIEEQLNLYVMVIRQLDILIYDIGELAFPADGRGVVDFIQTQVDTTFNKLDSAIANKNYLLEYDDIHELDRIGGKYHYMHPRPKWANVKVTLELERRKLCYKYNKIIPKYHSSMLRRDVVQSMNCDKRIN